MIRTLFLLLAWFVAVPSFSQGKPTSPSTQEQLLELRLEQQHLKEKFDDQKASLEEKFEVRKENLEYQREETNDWITLFGLVVTVIGIGLPVINFFIGKRIVMDVEKQKNEANRDLDELKRETKEKLSVIVREAEIELQKIKEKREADELIRTGSGASLSVAMEGEIEKQSGKEKKVKFDFSQQADMIERSEYATPFQKAMANALELYFAGKYEESIKQNLSILDEFKSELTLSELPDFYFRLANSYYIIKGFKSAIDYYEKSLALNPFNYMSWNNLGTLYSEESIHDKSIDCLSKVVELNPTFAEGWSNLGLAYNNRSNEGDYDIAINMLNRSIALKSDKSGFWFNRGLAYYNRGRLGDFDTAIDDFKKARNLNCTDNSIWYNLGLSYRKRGKEGDIDREIECFKKVVDLMPTKLEGWLNLSKSCCQRGHDGDYETAILSQKKLSELNGDVGIIHNLAELQIIQNQDASGTFTKLRAVLKEEKEEFNTLLLETIWNVKSKTYAGTVADTFEQLKRTVSGDASKVTWGFELLNEWLAREETNPLAPDKKTKEFVTDLIQRIEKWRGSQPKAE